VSRRRGKTIGTATATTTATATATTKTTTTTHQRSPRARNAVVAAAYPALVLLACGGDPTLVLGSDIPVTMNADDGGDDGATPFEAGFGPGRDGKSDTSVCLEGECLAGDGGRDGSSDASGHIDRDAPADAPSGVDAEGGRD
jgi:hypothetical protein